MDVLISLDRKFVMVCGVMLRSLLDNNGEEEIICHAFIDDSLTESDKNDLKDVFDGERNRIIFYDITNYMEGLPQPSHKHWTKMTYCRLIAPKILPTEVEKVLYLDGDVIVCQSLKELWRTDISSVAVAAVLDVNQLNHWCNQIQMKSSTGYFNAGVLLINLSYWRANGLCNKFLAFIDDVRYTEPERIERCDQDILNYFLQDSKKLLPLKYNVETPYYYKLEYSNFPYYDYEDEINDAIAHPAILHFVSERPWEKGCKHPKASEFFKYRERTKWSNEPLKERERRIGLRGLLKNIYHLIVNRRLPESKFAVFE